MRITNLISILSFKKLACLYWLIFLVDQFPLKAFSNKEALSYLEGQHIFRLRSTSQRRSPLLDCSITSAGLLSCGSMFHIFCSYRRLWWYLSLDVGCILAMVPRYQNKILLFCCSSMLWTLRVVWVRNLEFNETSGRKMLQVIFKLVLQESSLNTQ